MVLMRLLRRQKKWCKMIILKEEFTIDDALVGLFYDTQHSEDYKKKLNRYRLVSPLIWLACASVIFYIRAFPIWIYLIILTFCILWYVFYPIRFKKLILKKHREFLKNKIDELGALLTKKDVFHLSKEQIIIEGNNTQTTITPNHIEKMLVLNTHLVIFVKSGGTISFNKDSANYDTFYNFFTSLNLKKESDLNWKI